MSTLGSGALRGLAFALLTLLQLCFASYVSAQAGTVLATNGQNQITRATQIITPLKPGNAVQANDTIVTEANGRLQVRFVDGAIVSMQPGTQFKVDQYTFREDESSSFFSLLRGAVRMASGLIGKKDPEQWRLSTPSATIGIRGTHFVVEHTVCDPDCSPGNKPGTRVAVTQGEVVVSNAAGTIILGAHQSAFVTDQDSPPLAARWTPELMPRTVPKGSTQTGPGDATRPGDAADPNDSKELNGDAREGNDASRANDSLDQESDTGRNENTDNEQANEPSPGALKPIGNGANNGLRWEPDRVNPFDPVRDIALADPNLNTGNTPTYSQQPDNQDQNSGNDRENESDASYPDDTDSNQSSDNTNNGGNNSGNPDQGTDDTADVSNPGVTDPDDTNPGVGDPGDPSVGEPNDGGPVTDPGTSNPNDPNNPNNPGPSNSTTPQTGTSIAANWFLDLRPMPNLVQQGLLADPQSAVVFDQGITLESIGRCDGGICLSRGTTQVVDAGHDEYAAWGRWTNGEMHIQVFGLTQPVALSENEGMHYIVGSPTVTVPTSGSFSYNLTASTSPTMNNDWYAPGSFSGQASVQFSAGAAPRVGLEAQVDFANDQFRFNTSGGAADPSQSELTLDSNLRFSGQLDANGGQNTLPWMCSSGGCRARVEGALFGPTGERLGVSYSIHSESGSTRINGVGIFSRP